MFQRGLLRVLYRHNLVSSKFAQEWEVPSANPDGPHGYYHYPPRGPNLYIPHSRTCGGLRPAQNYRPELGLSKPCALPLGPGRGPLRVLGVAQLRPHSFPNRLSCVCWPFAQGKGS